MTYIVPNLTILVLIGPLNDSTEGKWNAHSQEATAYENSF